MLDDTPIFNLKVVVKETGLKADTLRVWERRYGIPDPNRTSGGHRLYSERDIAVVNWLQARKREGLSISRAVSMWKRLLKEGQDPLETTIFDTEGISDVSKDTVNGDTISELREAWLQACLAFNESQCERVLAQAFAIFSPEIVVLELLQKTINEIGEGWYKGTMSVQQEHFASALVTRHLNVLLMAAAPPVRSGRALVASPSGEGHSIGLLVFTWMLRRRGWDVVIIGADVPLEHFRATLELVKPKVVALSAQQLSTVGALKDMARMLVDEGIPVVYGGRIFEVAPELARWIPGRYLAGGMVEAVNLTEQILAGHRLPLEEKPELKPDFNVDSLLAHFIAFKSQLTDSILFKARDLFEQYSFMTTVHEMMVRSVIAVLKIGRIEFLEIDVEWVRGLMKNFNIPQELMETYLAAFYQALLSNLDRRGKPLLTWFEGRI